MKSSENTINVTTYFSIALRVVILTLVISLIGYWDLHYNTLSTEAGLLTLEWIQKTKLTASDGTENDIFGSSVAIYEDTVIIGALGDDEWKGSAYVFKKSDDDWSTLTQVAKLTASDGVANDCFGYSVAMDSDVVIIGTLDSGIYCSRNVPGSAYIFIKPAGGWTDMTQTAKLTASDGFANDYFGHSVAISGDTAAVGAFSPNAVYVFVKPSGGWSDITQTAKLTASDSLTEDQLGVSVAISGDTLVAGAPGNISDQGSAYVFEKPIGGWINMTQTAKLRASDGEIGDRFGESIALNNDTAVVGSLYDQVDSDAQQGSAYVFEKPITGWITMTQTAKLTASDGEAYDWFGWSVGLSENRVVMGAAFDEIDANAFQGSVYVYEEPEENWQDMTETVKITLSDGEADDGFGWSVALEINTLLVGAYMDDTIQVLTKIRVQRMYLK